MATLLLKKKETLNLNEKIMYDSYQQLVREFLKLAISREYTFDPIFQRYMGFEYDKIEKIDKQFAMELESVLPIFSYLGHSQGGRGVFIEKILCVLNKQNYRNVKLNELPIILKQLPSYRIFKILGKSEMSGLDIRNMENIKREYKWIGNKYLTIDLCKFFDNTFIFGELKNRIDSGGTSGRREMWISKVIKLLELLISQKPIFQNGDENLSLYKLLCLFGIRNLKICVCIPFNTNGSSANLGDDKKFGFYSESKSQFESISDLIEKDEKFEVINKDVINLDLKCVFNKELNISISGIYGDDIVKLFLNEDLSTWDKVKEKIPEFSDIWASLRLSMNERKILIETGTNLIVKVLELFEKDIKLKKEFCKIHGAKKIEKQIKDVTSLVKNHFPKENEKRINSILVFLSLALGNRTTKYWRDLIEFINI